jgi:hypothetical protein
LRDSLAETFLSRWALDVELLARLRYGINGHIGYGESDFLELPLDYWEDKSGSKLTFVDKIKVDVEMIRITAYARRLRK